MHLMSRRRECRFDVASTPPSFTAVVHTARPVVPIYYPGTSERIRIWFRRTKLRQNVQVLLLTLIFGLAGGVTGGILAAVNHSLARDDQTSIETEETTQSLAPVEDAMQIVDVKPPQFRARRRVFSRPRPRPQLVTVYGSFDFKQGKKANHVQEDEDY